MDSSNCCICLDTIDINEKTFCCKNYIHKICLLTWIIYNCKIECCLCRSDKIKISFDDIIKYDINNIKEYNIDSNIFINNMNEIINKLNNNSSFIIQINDNISVNNSILSTSSNNRISKKFKDLLFLFLIPIFYILIFFIIPLKHKYGNTDID